MLRVLWENWKLYLLQLFYNSAECIGQIGQSFRHISRLQRRLSQFLASEIRKSRLLFGNHFNSSLYRCVFCLYSPVQALACTGSLSLSFSLSLVQVANSESSCFINRFHRGQPVYVEGKDISRFAANISAIGTEAVNHLKQNSINHVINEHNAMFILSSRSGWKRSRIAAKYAFTLRNWVAGKSVLSDAPLNPLSLWFFLFAISYVLVQSPPLYR